MLKFEMATQVGNVRTLLSVAATLQLVALVLRLGKDKKPNNQPSLQLGKDKQPPGFFLSSKRDQQPAAGLLHCTTMHSRRIARLPKVLQLLLWFWQWSCAEAKTSPSGNAVSSLPGPAELSGKS